MSNEIQLGDRVKCRITGAEGIVVSITDWLYNCRRLGIQLEKLIDGKQPVPELLYFDEPQLLLIKSGAVEPPTIKPIRRTGGPMRPEPPARNAPRR